MKKIVTTIQDKFNLLVIIMIVYMLLSILIYIIDNYFNSVQTEYILTGFLMIPLCFICYFSPLLYDWLYKIITFNRKKDSYFTVYLLIFFCTLIIISLFASLFNGIRLSRLMLSLNFSNFLFLGTISLLKKKKHADI